MGQLEKRFPRYSRILNLYPAPYRKRYHQEILQTLADMLDDSNSEKVVVWVRVLIDLPLSLTKQNLIYVGGIMETETPHFVKRNSLLAAALIVPFFAIILTHALQHNPVKSSFVWQSLLYIILIFMPLAAFLLSTYTFIRWSRSRKMSLLKSLVDIRRSWMVVGVGTLALLIALFVPFHDSTHCVTGNPISEIQHASKTWQCLWRG